MVDAVDRRRDESGFTLVELVAAMGVMFAVLVGMSYAATVALVDVGYARQRQGATGLANEAIEQVRALPFQTLQRGLDAVDVAATPADPRIQTVNLGGGLQSRVFKGESLVQSIYPAGTVQAPLVPHISTRTVGQTTYRVAVYVTTYNNQATSGALRVTAVVSWAAKMRAGARGEVEIQTVVHPGSGCQSTAVHPYAAPCQAFYYASSAVDAGAITITGSMLGKNNLDIDETYSEAGLLVTPTQRSVIQSEQVTTLQSSATTSGATLRLAGVETKGGQVGLDLAGDDDPARAGLEYLTQTAPLQGYSDLGTGRHNELWLHSPEADAATATVAAQATSSQRCGIDDVSDAETDALPCSSAGSRQANTSEASVTFTHPGSLGRAVVAAIAGTDVVTRTASDLRRESTGAVCTGRGCIRSRATRALGTVSLGGLPASFVAPSDWDGYFIRLSSYRAEAVAHAGETAAASAATITDGSIKYWTGSGYATCTLADPTAGDYCPDEIPVAPLTAYAESGNYRVDISADFVRPGRAAIGGGCTAGDPCAEATASASSPVAASLKYRVSHGVAYMSTIADLTVDVNLGNLVAQSTYKAPPGA